MSKSLPAVRHFALVGRGKLDPALHLHFEQLLPPEGQGFILGQLGFHAQYYKGEAFQPDFKGEVVLLTPVPVPGRVMLNRDPYLRVLELFDIYPPGKDIPMMPEGGCHACDEEDLGGIVFEPPPLLN